MSTPESHWEPVSVIAPAVAAEMLVVVIITLISAILSSSNAIWDVVAGWAQ